MYTWLNLKELPGNRLIKCNLDSSSGASLKCVKYLKWCSCLDKLVKPAYWCNWLSVTASCLNSKHHHYHHIQTSPPPPQWATWSAVDAANKFSDGAERQDSEGPQFTSPVYRNQRVAVQLTPLSHQYPSWRSCNTLSGAWKMSYPSFGSVSGSLFPCGINLSPSFMRA